MLLTHYQSQRKTLNSFRIDPSCECWIDVFVKLADRTFFQNWPNFFLCTVRKNISGPATLDQLSEWTTSLPPNAALWRTHGANCLKIALVILCKFIPANYRQMFAYWYFCALARVWLLKENFCPNPFILLCYKMSSSEGSEYGRGHEGWGQTGAPGPLPHGVRHLPLAWHRHSPPLEHVHHGRHHILPGNM